ncbi:MAG TPA: hypothetical protein VFS66_07255 [Acidimicrobiia bacterium]|nr:hypothetical protein [Acidimicrobiia bacterium]
MPGYLRSVLFRFLGALAGVALFLGLIVLALTNFDTPAGLPEEFNATWPFWLAVVLVTGGVFLLRRRLGAGPGWGAYAVGVAGAFLALILNARTGNALWFWLILAAVILIPYPTRSAPAVEA